MKCYSRGFQYRRHCGKGEAGECVKKEREVAKEMREEFFVVEQIMEHGNIQLRDWNKNTIEGKTVPPQQLKKIYLDDMKMEDLERNFK